MDAALQHEHNSPIAEVRQFQGETPFGFEVLNKALERIVTAPNGQQEFTLSLEALKLGHFVAGGVLDYQPTVQAAIDAGMQMVNHDPYNKWTRSQVTRKVVRRMRRGVEEPWDDGAALDVATEEVFRRYREDPKLHESVLELLRQAEVKAEPAPEEPLATAAEAAEPQQAPPPAAAGEQPPQEQPKAEQPPPHPWLRTGEQQRIRRAGQGVPAPVAFIVDGLFHAIGTGLIAGKFSTGKTYVATSLAASVATGKPFAGCEVNRQGAVLWLAAEGEREVDKRIRAAVTALGGDPDNVPVYTQRGGVPKILTDPKGVGEIISQTSRAARAEFDLPLALIVIDTTIKAAGYKKSENDSVEVNAVIHTMEDYAHAYKCYVLFIDHAGWAEDRSRGSSDKPSSVDTYAVITNGKKVKQLCIEKVKGEKGHMSVPFSVVGVTQDSQPTAVVKWGQWKDADSGPMADLQKDDKLLYDSIVETINEKGVGMKLYENDMGLRRCVKKFEVRHTFYRKKGGSDGANRNGFARSWDFLLHHDPPFFSIKPNGAKEDMTFVFFDEGP
jgi:hypothetical protein